MSSVRKCVPNRSMAGRLRAAQIRSRSFRKGCSYSTHFRPISAITLNPAVDASTRDQSSYMDDVDDPSACEFWCSSRLTWSRLNRSSTPPTRATKPWVSLSEGNGILDANPNPSLKRSRTKKETPSPSEYLIDTLQNMALSDTHAKSWTLTGETHQRPIYAPLTLGQRQKLKRGRNLSLHEIIADYIQFVEPVLEKWKDVDISKHDVASVELNNALENLGRGEFYDFLESQNFDIADVAAWAWVAKSSTAYEAALRIFVLEADRAVDRSGSRARMPYLIPKMLLRRDDLDLKTFRLVLIYCLHIITGQRLPPCDYSLRSILEHLDADDLHIYEQTCASLVSYLLSHAQRLWPEMQLPITQALAFYMRTAKYKRNSEMAKTLNMCLYRISLPSGPRPFVSVSVRQQAQFDLLRAMAGIQPALPVTRLGYRGMASLQLSHKKTTAEREFGELKAPSWPPWEEKKAGIDFDKGVGGAKSRAMHVLDHMTEAGYPRQLWEQVLGVLAGWDTDNSPTIQTRTLMRASGFWDRKERDENHPAIWAARIEATRTLREAWACFTAYEDRGLAPHSKVYAAMATKLLSERMVSRVQRRPSKLALPGDGLEIFPEPTSSRDWIYTRTEPPSLSDFLMKMLSEGIRPSGRLLASLLQYAPTFQVGIDCLNSSDLSNQQLRSLFSIGEDLDVESQKALNELPEYLFAAFIHFLCRFSRLTQRKTMNSPITLVDVFPIASNNWETLPNIPTLFSYTSRYREWKERSWYPRLLAHAVRLLRKRNAPSSSAWIQMLTRFRSNRVPISEISRDTQVVLAWYETMQVSRWMDQCNSELGSAGFIMLCESFHAAVTTRWKKPNVLKQGLTSLDETDPASAALLEIAKQSHEDMINDGLILLKSQFDSLVLVDPRTSPLFESLKSSLEERTESQITIPVLPHVPPPALLHAFVRALGAAEDLDGLLNLLRWMSSHASTLKMLSGEYLAGDKKMRPTIVALRIYLEGYSRLRKKLMQTEHASDCSSSAHSDPYLQEAYEIVTATETWGPWPSDEEVRRYFSNAMSKTNDRKAKSGS
ncbi:hypothetical protein BJY04DRAFT_226889 [Aspergillus karnatakaensis]|uniref:uncharacterized protein n=1 Tax=Aspergillus karnatakaensis TaxID=1810916 RepID=UPI003CCE40D3